MGLGSFGTKDNGSNNKRWAVTTRGSGAKQCFRCQGPRKASRTSRAGLGSDQPIDQNPDPTSQDLDPRRDPVTRHKWRWAMRAGDRRLTPTTARRRSTGTVTRWASAVPASQCKRNRAPRRKPSACSRPMLITVRIRRAIAALIFFPEIVMKRRIGLPLRLARLIKNQFHEHEPLFARKERLRARQPDGEGALQLAKPAQATILHYRKTRSACQGPATRLGATAKSRGRRLDTLRAPRVHQKPKKGARCGYFGPFAAAWARRGLGPSARAIQPSSIVICVTATSLIFGLSRIRSGTSWRFWFLENSLLKIPRSGI